MNAMDASPDNPRQIEADFPGIAGLILEAASW
jgi:hypothetical protein